MNSKTITEENMRLQQALDAAVEMLLAIVGTEGQFATKQAKVALASIERIVDQDQNKK